MPVGAPRVQLLAFSLVAVGHAAMAQPACFVRGKAMRRVAVSVPAHGRSDGMSQLLSVGGVAAAATLGAETSSLSVTGALEFEGAVPTRDLRLRVAEPVDVAGGIVHLEAGAADVVAHADADGRGVFDVDVGPCRRATIKNLALPCAALTLDEVEPRLHERPAAIEVWHLRPGRVVFYEHPGGSQSVEVEVHEQPPEWRPLVRVRAKTARWWNVELGDSAVTVVGWIEREALDAPRRPTSEGIGCGQGGFLCPSVHSRPPRAAYIGWAKIDRDAPVYLDPSMETAPWATVQSQLPLRVIWPRGAEFVELTNVPQVWGVCGSDARDKRLRGAYVPAAAVHVSPSPRGRATLR